MGDSKILSLLKKIGQLEVGVYVFVTVFLFYLFLWVVNPENKIIAISFIGLFGFLYFRIKNYRLMLLFTYLASLIVHTGKTYTIQLIPPGLYPAEWYPQGYLAYFAITPSLILALIMGLILFRDFVTGHLKLPKFKFYDLALFFYFSWLIISDVFGSGMPKVSILFSITYISFFIFYFYSRSYAKKGLGFIPALIGLFAALIVFESITSFQQFMGSSPLYKNIESQVGIEQFGSASDELEFRFRPVGTFEHANILGMWMSFCLSVIFVYFYKKRTKSLLLILSLGFVSLILTLSRSAWLGIIVSLLFSLYILENVKKIKPPLIFKKYSLSFILVFLVLILFFIFPRAEKSLYALNEGGGYFRYLQIQDTLPIIFKNPLFGVGTGMSVMEGLNFNPKGFYSQVPLAIHNWYLLLLAEHGIPGLLFFIMFLWLALRENLNLIWKEKMMADIQVVRLGFVAGALSLVIVGFFQPFLGEYLIFLAFAILGSSYYEKS